LYTWLERSPACKRACQKHGTSSATDAAMYHRGPRGGAETGAGSAEGRGSGAGRADFFFIGQRGVVAGSK
jgi:hypothetical protein